MRRGLLDVLACPGCAGPLALDDERSDGAHVVRGALSCGPCARRWPIEDGVPSFVSGRGADDVEGTTRGFARNWLRYSDVIMASPALNDELFRDWIAPMRPERFAGRRVLDAGCGMGRWLAAAAPHGPRMLVGFDYSEVAHAAYANTRHLDNVHVLRADIFAMPLRRGAFDVCYSIGVLHHTPDPRGGFDRLLDVVADDGAIAVWVYGEENNAWIERVVTPLRERVTSRLPDRALHALSKLLTVQLLALSRTYAAVFPRGSSFSYDAYARHLLRYPPAYVEHIVYDHLVPSLARYLPRAEVEAWATAHALPHVLTARNANSWRLVAARSDEALARLTTPA